MPIIGIYTNGVITLYHYSQKNHHPQKKGHTHERGNAQTHSTVRNLIPTLFPATKAPLFQKGHHTHSPKRKKRGVRETCLVFLPLVCTKFLTVSGRKA